MQRNTVQKQIILDALIKLGTHPTVEEVYAEVQKKHPTISKTTVYRNLRGLAEAGKAHQVALPDSTERYDGYTEQHYHFRCRSCTRVFDIEVDHLEDINNIVQNKYNHKIDRHDVIFIGICIECEGGS